MFEYIRGVLISIAPNQAVVEVGGLGYLLHTPLTVFYNPPLIGQEVTFYISTVIREDSHKYFGFLSAKERNLFETISTVSGIGAKTALALIGHLGFATLESAITTANGLCLSKVPGIGKKTAERLIVELQDKLFKQAKKEVACEAVHTELSKEDQAIKDATLALIHLGYTSLQAQQAVRKAIDQQNPPFDLSTLIRFALSHA